MVFNLFAFPVDVVGVDALSIFFAVLTLLAACLAWFDCADAGRGEDGGPRRHYKHQDDHGEMNKRAWWSAPAPTQQRVFQWLMSLLYVVQTVLVTLALLLAYATPHLFVVASLYSFAALVGAFQWWRRHSWQHVLVRILWAVMPCVSLWLAYGIFWHETGVWRYDMPAVHIGLTSFVFWFVFLATLFGSGTRLYCYSQFPTLVMGIAWLYPFMRLYSIGAWNAGWHTVTIWSGLAVALWSALFPATFRHRDVCTRESRWFVQVFIALALAMVGLGSMLSVAGACCALLVALFVGLTNNNRASWFVSGVVPFSAPWMVFWMGMSAVLEQGYIVGVALIWATGVFFAAGVLQRSVGKITPSSLSIALGSIVVGALLPMCMKYSVHAVLSPLDGVLATSIRLRLWPWSSLFSASAPYTDIEVMLSVVLVACMVLFSIAAWALAGCIQTLSDK